MSRRVFIVWTNLLFYEALQALLNHPDIEVVGACSEPAAAQAQIEGLHPDTVIVEELESTTDTNIEVLSILESSAWDPRILRLSIHNNRLTIYQCQHRNLEQIQDLLGLI